MSQLQSLQESFNILFGASVASLFFGCPGFIEGYDASQNLANVVPVFEKANFDIDNVKNILKPPVIPNCPVVFMRSGGGYIKTPDPVRGDPVWLSFSQRSMDKYLETDGKQTVDPDDYRILDLTDAVVFVGMTTARNTLPSSHGTNVILGFENGKTLHMTPGSSGEVWSNATKFRFGSESANIALARADKVDEKLNALKDKYNNHMTLVLGVPVPILPTDVWINIGSTENTKVYVSG